MAVSIVIDITQNSQSVANNTSNVTVKVNAKWTGGSYNTLEKSGYCIIDGEKYTFTSPFNTGRTTSGTGNLFTKMLDISHGSDGKKTLAVSASYTSGVSSGTVAASASKVLTTIPRKSTLSVSDGTLGTSQTLTVTRQSTGFTHSIKAVCGSSTLYIKADGSTQTSESIHNDCSIPFTPPLSWASQNTSGTSVSVKYTITTYTTGPAKVAEVSYTVKYTIPASVKPSCSITIEDVGTTLNGNHIQGMAKLKITVTPTLAYGSAISSYKTIVNGKTYTSASFTTDLINEYGELTISSAVTDKRGRIGVKEETIILMPYHKPVFILANASRAKMLPDGPVLDPQGNFMYVTFTASVSALSGLNTASYDISYKKATDPNYTHLQAGTIPADSMKSYSYGIVFQADTSSSYDVKIILYDAVQTLENPTERTIPASTAAVFMSWHSPDGSNNYDGLALGKVAEESDLFDVGWNARFNKPVYGKVAGLDRLPAIPANSDLNDYMETGCWAVQSNAIAETVANMPVQRAGRFEVIASTGEGVRETQWSYLRQRFVPYNAENAIWERDVTRSADNVWRYYEWNRTTLTPEAAQRVYSKAAMTIALSANSVLGIVNTYTKIPFNKSVLSTNDRLTLSSNAIRIGAGIQHIKVNGQALVSPGSTDGLRHIRIQKVSGSTTTSIAWGTLYFTSSRHLAHALTPILVSVKEGDLLQMVFYTGNANDSISSGSAANGYQTYLTVEEL